MVCLEDLNKKNLERRLDFLDVAIKDKNINFLLLHITSFERVLDEYTLSPEDKTKYHQKFYEKLNTALGGDWNYRV